MVKKAFWMNKITIFSVREGESETTSNLMSLQGPQTMAGCLASAFLSLITVP